MVYVWWFMMYYCMVELIFWWMIFCLYFTIFSFLYFMISATFLRVLFDICSLWFMVCVLEWIVWGLGDISSSTGSQYLLPEDMDWFLFCAQKLAASPSSSSVAFYVASDSLRHMVAFAKGIAAAAASASNGRRGKSEWVVLTAEVFNNATDSWTGDTFGDLMVKLFMLFLLLLLLVFLLS